MNKREVVRLTLKAGETEQARFDLHNYHYDPRSGAFKVTYSGPPIPQGATVQVPHSITRLIDYIGQGTNFDVVVYQDVENHDRYVIDITRIWQ